MASSTGDGGGKRRQTKPRSFGIVRERPFVAAASRGELTDGVAAMTDSLCSVSIPYHSV